MRRNFESDYYRAVRQNKIIIAVAVLFVLLMGVLYFQAISKYIAVQKCMNNDLSYFASHHCSTVLDMK